MPDRTRAAGRGIRPADQLRTVLNKLGPCPRSCSLLLCLALAACGGGSTGDGEVVVVGTTTQVGDFLGQVAGERADVRQILRPNSDPHDYEPRPSDVKALSEATLVVRSGGDVDDWLDGLVDNAGSDAAVLDLSEVVSTREEDGELDPHWWQDPRNAMLAVEAIRDRLAGLDPGGAARLPRGTPRATSAGWRASTATPPPASRGSRRARRKLVTTHDALGYYARRYGLEVIGAVLPVDVHPGAAVRP